MGNSGYGKRIGLYGGSFNPPHSGHVEIVKTILKNKLVDDIWVLPTVQHHFKANTMNEQFILNMCGVAFKSIRNVTVDPLCLENDFEGSSYKMIKFLRKTIGKKYKFSLIIGVDCALQFHKWYNYKKLLKLVHLIIVMRPKFNSDENWHWMKSSSYTMVELNNGISSSDIRTSLSNVNGDVLKIIAEEGLYTSESNN